MGAGSVATDARTSAPCSTFQAREGKERDMRQASTAAARGKTAPPSKAAKPSPVPCTFIARRPSFERDDRRVLASLLADLGLLPDCRDRRSTGLPSGGATRALRPA